MELVSTVNDSWKYFAAGSFVGFTLLILFAYQVNPYTSFLAARDTTVVEFVPLDETKATVNVIKPLEHFNITVTNPVAELSSKSEDGLTNSEVEISSKPEDGVTNSEAELSSKPEDGVTNSEAELSSKPEDAVTNSSVAELSSKAEDVVTNSVAELSSKPEDVVTNSVTELSSKHEDFVEPLEEVDSKECNMYEGRWVYMPDEDTGYDSTRCPFIEEKMSCRKNGRPDFEYEKWRWEAKDCNIPLFNGRDMLERLRNKRVILVGDSLNRNMWISLACLLYSSIPSSSVEVSAESPVYKILKAKDYNCTVEFYWSPFLVEFIEKHVSGRKVLVLDKLSPNSLQWKGADVMVFNSGHWWLHGGKMKSWDLFEYEGKLVEDMQIELAYERAMTTWATWINKNILSNNTSVYFRSLSAVHHSSDDWCYNATRPLEEESLKSVAQRSDVLVPVILKVIEGVERTHVNYMNITKLSQYRRDAHPSIYRSSQWKVMIKKFESSLTGYADCSHWCLPGLPDTWNRLLYASLFFDTSEIMSSP